jgi:hypothetical protein
LRRETVVWREGWRKLPVDQPSMGEEGVGVGVDGRGDGTSSGSNSGVWVKGEGRLLMEWEGSAGRDDGCRRGK